MELLLNIGYVLLGFILLIKGGDYLVEGAVSIARIAKLTPMVIGLTVVGFGTSAPELLVSVQSAMAGNSGIAIGNVVGSNIANICLILGLTAIILPIPAKKSTLHIDMPFMILAVCLLAIVGYVGTITRWEGIVGILMLVCFVAYQVINSRKHHDEEDHSLDEFKQHGVVVALVMVVLSCAALSYGADKLIEGASYIASSLGVSDRIIGLTIVAVGTSFPELFASISAARKGQTDMAIGNIVGSVTFNVLSVIGISAAITPIANANSGFVLDYIFMVGVSFLLFIFLFTRRLLERWEGWFLFVAYAVYIGITLYKA